MRKERKRIKDKKTELRNHVKFFSNYFFEKSRLLLNLWDTFFLRNSKLKNSKKKRNKYEL